MTVEPLASLAQILPATGLVLIGTTSTLSAMWSQIEFACCGVVPAGCVLVEPGANLESFGAIGHLPPIIGTLENLVELQSRRRFRLALVSLPAGMAPQLARLRAGLDRLALPHHVVPTLAELLTPSPPPPPPPPPIATLRAAPQLDPASLIGRTHYGLDRRAVGAILTGRRVLITGAGGSIGSELARVAAGFDPERVILMERAENSLFNIDHHLGRRFPSVARKAVLHDVVDARTTARLIAEHKPDVVFHAAAHKHVPLMEDHPGQALDNNLFGTRSIADACADAGVGRFVLISSDKAVNPTSVMGATKRVAEMYVQGLARQAGHSTLCSVVRFGNVLASACSVVPIWQQQIAEGGPVTVTDPRMTRYFMTIPEAATLVAQAAALSARPGTAPVYVLDMGEPIRIFDLAVRFVRMHGLEPVVRAAGQFAAGVPMPRLDPADAEPGAATIELVMSGVRPGEKLFEQLAYAAEQLEPTAHPGINCWAGHSASDVAPLDNARLIAEMDAIRGPGGDRARVLEALRRFVPEFVSPSESAAA